MKTAEYWIKNLELQAHPEGGFFKETYRSQGVITKPALPPEYSGDRSFSTAIYFLLKRDNYSAFHKIHQDEMWHFYAGTALIIHVIYPDGHYARQQLGNNFEVGENLQVLVTGGCYFAAEVADKTSYTLCGCTVAPGFDFDDFDMPDKDILIKLFPQYEEIIMRLGKR